MMKISLPFFLVLLVAAFGIGCPRQAQSAPGTGEEVSQMNQELPAKMSQAWKIAWSRFYSPKTNQFYDYLSSYAPGRELAHLPAAAEVSRQYPNPYGYGTGMEDCMISAGVMLSMILDRYRVTHDAALAADARKIFKGIERSATVHGVPGFLARGVCPEDGAGVYINSSRDQYTHCVYSLWEYYHTPLCDADTKASIRKILAAIADRMTRNVTPENDYDFLRADGTRDPRGICRMLDVDAHEAARLPMFYAAAWDVSGDVAYYRLYRKYLAPAITQSFELKPATTTYALQQMQCSLELLLALETDPALKAQMEKVMRLAAERTAPRAINAAKNGDALDLTALGPDWHQTSDLSGLSGEYRKVWYCPRESGEAALTQLMVQDQPFPEQQKELLAHAITRLDYEHASSSGIFYLLAAYWKACNRGVFPQPRP